MTRSPDGFAFMEESGSALGVPGAQILTLDSELQSLIEATSIGNGRVQIILPATILDEENLNKRVYPTSVMESSVGNSLLKEKMKSGFLIGAGDDHPSTPYVPPIRGSHIIRDAWVQKIGSRSMLMNTWETMDTDNGRNLRALIEAGAAFGVSIRGFGRTDNKDNSVGKLQEYQYLGTDAVGEPSAQLFAGINVPHVTIAAVGESVNKAVSSVYFEHIHRGELVHVDMFSEVSDNDRIRVIQSIVTEAVTGEGGADNHYHDVPDDFNDVAGRTAIASDHDHGYSPESSQTTVDGNPPHSHDMPVLNGPMANGAPSSGESVRPQYAETVSAYVTEASDIADLHPVALGKLFDDVSSLYVQETSLKDFQAKYINSKVNESNEESDMTAKIKALKESLSNRNRISFDKKESFLKKVGVTQEQLTVVNYDNATYEVAYGESNEILGVFREKTGFIIVAEDVNASNCPECGMITQLSETAETDCSNCFATFETPAVKENGDDDEDEDDDDVLLGNKESLDNIVSPTSFSNAYNFCAVGEQITKLRTFTTASGIPLAYNPESKVFSIPARNTAALVIEAAAWNEGELPDALKKANAKKKDKDDDDKDDDKKEGTDTDDSKKKSADTDDSKKKDTDTDDSKKDESLSEATIGGAPVTATVSAVDPTPGSKNKITINPVNPPDWLPVKDTIEANGYQVIVAKLGVIEFLVPNGVTVSDLKFIQGESRENTGKTLEENMNNMKDQIVGIFDSTPRGAIEEVDKCFAKFNVSTGENMYDSLGDLKFSELNDMLIELQSKLDVEGSDPVADVGYEAKSMLEKGNRVGAIRRIMDFEESLNEDKDISSADLATTLESLDELKNDLFGDKKDVQIDESGDTGTRSEQVSDATNSVGRRLLEASGIIKGFLESEDTDDALKESIKKVEDYVTSVEETMQASAGLVTDLAEENAEAVSAISEMVTTDQEITDLKQAVSCFEQVHGMFSVVQEQLELATEENESSMALIEAVRGNFRTNHNKLKAKLESAHALIEHLRSRIRRTKVVQESDYQAPAKIHQHVTMIISRRPSLNEFRTELLTLSKSVAHANTLAEKYLRLPESSRDNGARLAEAKPRKGSGEKFLQNGQK